MNKSTIALAAATLSVLATAAVVVALVVVPGGTAHADPTTEPVDPSTAVSFPVLPFDARVLTIAFDIITRDEIHRDAGVRLALE